MKTIQQLPERSALILAGTFLTKVPPQVSILAEAGREKRIEDLGRLPLSVL
jgi:hypothetical protein